jgi:hypothetical protein
MPAKLIIGLSPSLIPLETRDYCILQTYAAIFPVLSITTMHSAYALKKYTNECSQHSRTNKLLTKITATSRTTNERMFSSWAVREFAVQRIVTVSMSRVAQSG